MSDETPTETIRPLHDVWLRPRRVFRELAGAPISRTDYLLGAAQGIVSWLALSRAQSAGVEATIGQIIGKALIAGPVAGVLGLYLMTAVYFRLGKRVGGTSARDPVFHVLAYSGVPMLVSLAIWLVTALLAGRATFIETQRADLEPFVGLLLHVQFISHVVLIGWSLLLQVMGLSEVECVPTRRAFGIWMLGQIIVMLAVMALWALILGLTSGAAPPPA